jgi:membrane protease YdiL (CAAX protease family)
VSEARLTLIACGVGLLAVPFAWRLVWGRPVAPLPAPRSPADRNWPLPLALCLLFTQLLALGFVIEKAPDSPLLARSLLAGSVAITILAAGLLAPRLVQPSLRAPQAVGAGVLTMLASLPFVYGVLSLEGLFVDLDTRQRAVDLLAERAPGWQETALAAMLLAPLAEELVFRVFFYGGLRRSTKPRAALLASAALFGLVHAVPPTTILPMFVFGLFLGRLMERTGSYLACLTAHAAFNIFGVAAALAT